MNPDDKEKLFLQQSKKLLDDRVDSLDAATLSRLNQARQKALNPRQSNWFSAKWAGVVFASFAVTAIAIQLWTAAPEQQTQPPLAQQYEDIDMLTADADLELLEDLEFVGWLLEENLDPNTDINDAG